MGLEVEDSAKLNNLFNGSTATSKYEYSFQTIINFQMIIRNVLIKLTAERKTLQT